MSGFAARARHHRGSYPRVRWCNSIRCDEPLSGVSENGVGPRFVRTTDIQIDSLSRRSHDPLAPHGHSSVFAVLPVKRRSRAVEQRGVRSCARTNAGFDSLHCGEIEIETGCSSGEERVIGDHEGAGAIPVTQTQT